MLFLLLTSLFLYSPHSSLAYEDPRVPLCNTKTAYAANSTFDTNLAVALAILRKTTAATGFNATTVGISTADSVTALALCRANLFSQDCQTCVDAATLGIRDSCPNATVAQVWYTSCMVRYSRINFINQSDGSIAFMLYNPLDAPDPEEYDGKVRILMQNLSDAAGVSNTRSAVAKTSFGTRNIYGYVDCTRDISGSDCTTCLLDAAYAIPSCCSGKWAGWIGTPTCNIQFNMDPVDHDDWINNPPEINTDISTAPASLPPPPLPMVRSPANQTTPRGGGGRLNGKETGVVIAVVVAFILVVGLVVVRWRVGSEKGKRAVEMEEMTMTMMESIGVRSFVYDLDVLVAATDNFSPVNQLGGGGFGSVYRTKRLKQEGRLMELVDVTMGSFPQEDVSRCIQIGLLCCKESVQDRPTMYSTLVMLTDNSITLPLGHQDHHNMIENVPMSPESFFDQFYHYVTCQW
ncbi:hypothetical protein Acr_27g0006770 [Actinidia rufa]|uniref:Gnk2-homologous domain-containing protein n=1 Tax=Actinidia rufa TaxID=165716 RepID=A0A7J0H7D9_9ERIC|nr:hypothetical protein Acr_27g0006770 [Actinidia rufa]